MEEESVQMEETGEKKKRKRHKQLFEQIRKQMEFYFSDANLHKDRYIKKLMDKSEDGYIDLSVFSNFNKLRALTDDMSLVAKALTKSNLIEVSEDKQRIKRKIPLSDPKDVDDRTVYVECLPMSATHDWVKKIFEVCGNVVYVSLPKYKTSRDIKGFGFVEFETVEGAQKACHLLHNPPAHAADKLGRFPRANKQMKQLENKCRSQKLGDLPGDPRVTKAARRQRTVSESAVTPETLSHIRKRRRTTSEGSDACQTGPRGSVAASKKDDPEPKLKRPKTHSESSGIGEAKSEESGSSSSDGEDDKENGEGKDKTESRKRKLAEDQGENQEEAGRVSPKKVRISDDIRTKENEEESKKKRTRHRKRKRKAKDDDTKKEVPELTVISKHDWSKLRKEYFQLQKSSMSQLKETLKKMKPESKEGNEDTMDTAEKTSPPKDTKPAIEFTPNVIIKVTGTKELSRKEVKEAASKLAEVAYVDIVEGSMEGFIRCHQESAATKLLEGECEGYTLAAVQGEEETKYWDKLKADREHKLSSKSKNKQRGRDKLFKKTEKTQKLHPEQRKHVIFEED